MIDLSSLRIPFVESLSDSGGFAIVCAVDEAQFFQHPFIGSEHLAIGSVRAGGDVGARLARAIDIERLFRHAMTVSSHRVTIPRASFEAAEARRHADRASIERRVTEALPAVQRHLTPRAQRNLGAAHRIAQRAGTKTDAECILLAVLADPDGVIGDAARAQAVRLFDVVRGWKHRKLDWGAIVALVREVEAGDKDVENVEPPAVP